MAVFSTDLIAGDPAFNFFFLFLCFSFPLAVLRIYLVQERGHVDSTLLSDFFLA